MFSTLEVCSSFSLKNLIAKEAEWLKNPIIIKNLALIDTQIQNYIKEKLQKSLKNYF